MNRRRPARSETLRSVKIRIGVLAMVLLCGGWMLFDGARALVLGDYVTPSGGRFAGRLGPWSSVVEAVGLEPRSTLVESIFVGYGALYVLAGLGWAAGLRAATVPLLVLASLGLWYLPFGTLLNLGVMVAILASRRSTAGGGGRE